jgi:hypothetical protein
MWECPEPKRWTSRPDAIASAHRRLASAKAWAWVSSMRVSIAVAASRNGVESGINLYRRLDKRTLLSGRNPVKPEEATHERS